MSPSDSGDPPIHICVCTPCYGSQVHLGYLHGMLQLVGACTQAGILLSYRLDGGDSLITRARNKLAADFLAEPSYTHLMWIDADIGFSSGAVLRLLAAGRDVVAGGYPLKTLAERRYAFSPLPGPAGAAADEDGFLPVLEAGTGFMLIRRAVLERMVAALPDLSYRPDMIGSGAGPHHRLFDTMVDEGADGAPPRYLSEDYAFCRRWQRLGGQVWLDTRAALTHAGWHVYGGGPPDLLAPLSP